MWLHQGGFGLLNLNLFAAVSQHERDVAVEGTFIPYQQSISCLRPSPLFHATPRRALSAGNSVSAVS